MNHETPLEIVGRIHAMKKPRDGRLSEKQKTELLQALEELRLKENLSHGAVSRLMRCSGTTWSLIRARKYGGDEDRYLNRALQWLHDRDAREETPRADYVRTKIGGYILTVCRRAWEVPCLGRVVTPSGCGKTAALKEFARLRGERAMYVRAGEAYATKTGLVVELATRLNVPVNSRTNTAMLYKCVQQKLAAYYAGGKADPFCLLVDEATTLSPPALNILRGFHDDEGTRCAVVLADTARLDAELHSRKGFMGGYEQLNSRLGAQYFFAASDEIAMRDVKAVAGSVLASLGDSPRVDAHAWGYLHKLAQQPGRLRNVVYRLHAVHDVAGRAGVRPRYTQAELDYVASLVGAAQELEHTAAPFGKVAVA